MAYIKSMKHDRTEAMLRMLFRSNECDSVHYETCFFGGPKNEQIQC